MINSFEWDEDFFRMKWLLHSNELFDAFECFLERIKNLCFAKKW